MNPKNILVPIDFSDYAKAALDEADSLAQQSGAELTLLHIHEMTQVAIMDFTYVEPPEKVAEILTAAEKQLQQWAEQLGTPPERRSIRSTTGGAAQEIIDESENYDLIVMPTHGRTGLSHFLLGSVAERVVQGAKCSVLIVKKPGEGE